jgi:DNA-binding NarL/FixJ family response regulator
VALANDYEIVCAGLEAMLAPYSARIEMVGPISVGAPLPTPIDVTLYDTYGREGLVTDGLRTLVEDPDAGRVALYTFLPSPDLIDLARDLGVAAVLPKTLRAAELVPALESIAAGCEPRVPPRGRSIADERSWPGKKRGLTERESEAVVLLAQGLRNQEIADALFVSIDTVKTHLRAAFRKLGVSNRAQATATVLRDPAFGRIEAQAP